MAVRIQVLQPVAAQAPRNVHLVVARLSVAQVPAAMELGAYFDAALQPTLQQSAYFAQVDREGPRFPAAQRPRFVVVPYLQAGVTAEGRILESCLLGATIIGLVVVFATPFCKLITSASCTLTLYDVTNLEPVQTVDGQTRQATWTYPCEQLEPLAQVAANSVAQSGYSFSAVRTVAGLHNQAAAQNLAYRSAEWLHYALQNY